jgi:hypothetical protein
MPDQDDTPIPDRSILGNALASSPQMTPEEITRWQETIIENKHFAAIGCIAANWAYLEQIVDHGSIMLANVPARRGLCLTSQIFGIRRKLDAYISLARLRPISRELIAKLNDFAEAARCLGGRRDRIVHDVWEFDHPSPPGRFEIKAEKKLIVRSVPESTETLLAVAADIEKLTERFQNLESDVLLVPLPSPGKPEQDTRPDDNSVRPPDNNPPR